MREKLIELLDQVQHSGLISFPAGFGEHQEHVRNDKIADHLIANGVTITPAVPGPKMGHDMSEVCYRNGGEAMREKVVELLKDCKAVAFGARRDEIQDMIEKVRKL